MFKRVSKNLEMFESIYNVLGRRTELNPNRLIISHKNDVSNQNKNAQSCTIFVILQSVSRTDFEVYIYAVSP